MSVLGKTVRAAEGWLPVRVRISTNIVVRPGACYFMSVNLIFSLAQEKDFIFYLFKILFIYLTEEQA